MQIDLFGNSKLTNREVTLKNAKEISGLEIYPDFIDKITEAELLKLIDNSLWLNDLSRRVQHYGFKYDYKARKIDETFFIGQLPEWLIEIACKIYEQKYINFMPNQAIINEYEIGQGIAAHIDCEPCFGDTIISLSLGSSCIMNFEHEPNSKDKVELFLEPRSLLVMKKESRFNWYHGIPQRKSDKFNGETIKRERRISITFRNVII